MKKLVASILMVALAAFMAFGNGAAKMAAAEKASKNYKIGIMTSTVTHGEELYRTAQAIKAEYGDKIVIQTFPDKASEVETTISNAMNLASDPDVKVIVFCQAFTGTIAAIQRVKAERPDILTIAAGPQEELDAVSQVADVVYVKGGADHGIQIAEAAYKMGAKRVLHYSFPRSMSLQVTVAKHDAMKKRAEELGMDFIDVTTPDPQGDAGVAGCQQFVLEDVERKIVEYGKDTAFYGSTMQMNEPMIKMVAEKKAIFTMPADPSPFMGFPAGLGIKVPQDKEGDTNYMIAKIKNKLVEIGMTGRMSSWNFALFPVFMRGGVQYAIDYCERKTNGKCDQAVLKADLEKYAKSKIQFTDYYNSKNQKVGNCYYFVGGLMIL